MGLAINAARCGLRVEETSRSCALQTGISKTFPAEIIRAWGVEVRLTDQIPNPRACPIDEAVAQVLAAQRLQTFFGPRVLPLKP